MTTLTLTEHRPSGPLQLSLQQQQHLRDVFDAHITPSGHDRVNITPGARVGVTQTGDRYVIVEPKLPIQQVTHMIAVSADPYNWRHLETASVRATRISDALAAIFARSCLNTFHRGVYRSYRRESPQLPYLKGRLRVADYMQSSLPLPVPVNVTVHDDDVLENQILCAALGRLRTLPALSESTYQMMNRAWSFVRHTNPPRDVLAAAQQLVWNRHNEYYRQAVTLALVVLNASTVELTAGDVEVPGFVINMPYVVEQYVRTTLRTAWRLPHSEFRDSWKGALWLDTEQDIELIPDLAVRQAGSWRFIGDVKYKELTNNAAHQDDIYQTLAYMHASGLTESTLVYAGTFTGAQHHRLVKDDRTITIVGIDLSRHDVRDQITGLVPEPQAATVVAPH